MALRSTLKSIKAMRLTLMAGVLLLAVLVATPASNLALAAPLQQSGGFTLVNEDEEFIKRHDDGDFEAKPIFSANPTWAGYGVKDPVTGEWLTALYFIQDDPKEKDEGWEYDIDYPEYDEQPELEPDRAYTLVLYVFHEYELHDFEVIIPAHEGSGLWDRVLNALNPSRWAKAFAGWVVEGIHGILCSVLSKITGSDPANC